MRGLLRAFRKRAIAACASIALALAPVAIERAEASQSSVVLPTIGPMSMSQFVTTYLNPALAAMSSCFSGTSAPTSGSGPAAIQYQCWVDTSTSPASFKFYDGSSWVTVGTIDAVNHVWTPASPPVSTQTTDYTIQTTDCGKTLQVGTGSTGQKTITLPSASGFAAGCFVRVMNGDTVRGKKLSGFPSTIPAILYPTQSLSVQVQNGAWAAVAFPGRWQPTATVNFYVDAVNGSNSNDGLAAGAGGALADPQAAINAAYKSFDFGRLSVGAIINSPGAITTGGLFAEGPWTGGLAQFPVVIDGNGTGSIVGTVNSAINVYAGATLQVQNITLSNSGSSGGSCAESHYGNATGLFLNNVTCAGSVSGFGIYISDQSFGYFNGSTINFTGTFAAPLIVTENNSVVIIESAVVNLTGDTSAPAFVESADGGVQDWASATINLNGHTFTGLRYQLVNGGHIDGGVSSTFFPGSGSLLQGVNWYSNLPEVDLSDASGTVKNQVAVGSGGTGLASLTAHGVMIGQGSSPPAFAAASTAGRAFIDQGSGIDPAWEVVSGDCTLASTGAITCLKTNGTSFTGSATAAAGQLPGTATNDNAAAGKVGEYIASSCPSQASTVTITIATPAVVTWSGSPFSSGNGRADVCPIVFTTSGALPTGLAAGTVYWTDPATISGNTFSVSTSAANALAGTDVATSGTQSGTQTGTAGQPLTTATEANVTALKLTAGDWDIWGLPNFTGGGTTAVTYVSGAISTASNNMPTAEPAFAQTDGFGSTLYGVGFGFIPITAGPLRVSLSGTTNYFLNVQSGFGTSTTTAFGMLRARRVR